MQTLIEEKSKFEVNLSTNEVLSKLTSTLNSKGWKEVSNSNDPLNLKFKIRTSFKSWGETLSINIAMVTTNKSSIEVISKPVFFGTMLDYGKNRNNVNIIKDIFNISY